MSGDAKPVTMAEILVWQSATRAVGDNNAYVSFDRLIATVQAAERESEFGPRIERLEKQAAKIAAEALQSPRERWESERVDSLARELEEAYQTIERMKALMEGQRP